MTNVKSLLEMYVKMGGSLTDTYSDIAGGVPVGQYSTISDAILACSKKYSAGGGGGAEKFVVTLTQDAQTEEWTADKTIAEIVAANEAGKIVVAVCKDYQPFGLDVHIPLSCTFSDEGNGAVFCSVADTYEKKYLVSAFGIEEGSDVWQFTTTPIPTSSNAPLIVTMTAGATEGQLVGDKTYKEVYDAFIAGQNCILNISDALRVVAVFAVGHETDYTINACGDISASGAANDYITVTISG